MGTLTRSELVTEIQSFFADRSDLTAAKVITWLNIAQTRMARKGKFQEFEVVSYDNTSFTSTPSDDKFFALPTKTRKV